MLSSVLYIARPIPLPSNLYTYMRYSFPLCPLNTTSKVPGSSTMKSVALYWSPNACLPIMIGFFQPGMSRGILLIRMGYLKTVPLSIFLMVPFGLFHIFFSLNYLTRASSGVIVAHLMPTLYFLIASAASMVTWSLVASRFSMLRS